MRLSSTCFAKTEFRTETSALPFQLLLGILDKATLRLGDNSRVDFSQTVVSEVEFGWRPDRGFDARGMEFVQPADKPIQGLDEKVGKRQERRREGSFLQNS